LTRSPALAFSADQPAASALATLRRELAARGVSGAALEARCLVEAACGFDRANLVAQGHGPLGEAAPRLAALTARRFAGEPLARILGAREFWGLAFQLSVATLVPRPETETLVEWALALLPARGPRRLLAIDVGTGSGCIACALASERADLDVVAIDVSPAAAAVARENVRALDLAGRVTVVAADLFAGLRDIRADLIVSNPPYLPSALMPELPPEVRIHEPRLALDGGSDGLAVIRRIATAARPYLRPSGALVVETAGGDQTSAAATLLRAAGWDQVAVRGDLVGIERFVAGRA
jgi:release factor glutamine methyltransferase